MVEPIESHDLWILGLLQTLTFFKSLLRCHSLSEVHLTALTHPMSFSFWCTFLDTVCLLWFLFCLFLLEWKCYRGKVICLHSLLHSQCLEWHLALKYLLNDWMNALIPISEGLLHPILSGQEVKRLGFAYWLCHRFPLSLRKSFNLSGL